MPGRSRPEAHHDERNALCAALLEGSDEFDRGEHQELEAVLAELEAR